MKNKKILIILLILVFSVVIGAEAASIVPFANRNIASTSILLNTSMKATFSCSANANYNISVQNIRLEVKNSNGTWSFVKNLSAPPSASNVSNYNKVMNYASSCTSGKTYRITATFNASGETTSNTSAARTYQ